jgi:hypothetical protein
MDERRRRNRLTPAAALLGDGLATVGGDLGRVVGVWPAVVGDRLARVTTPARLRDGTLQVRCASASWAQTLNGIEQELLERLDEQLGRGRVRRIHARAGGPAPRLDVEPPPPPLPPLAAGDREQLEQLVAHIDDPDLRARLLAAAVATARRRATRPDR